MRLSMFLVPFALTACTTQSTDGTDQPAESGIAQALCPSPAVFEAAVCLCENLDHIGDLVVEPGPGGVGAVGVNGTTTFTGRTSVAGSFIGWGGITGVGTSVGTTIGDSLITPAGVSGVGTLDVAGNVSIGGDLLYSGTFNVGGDFALGGTENVIGELNVANRVAYTAPAGPPCGCDPATFFDVAAAVEAAKQLTGGHTSWTHVGDSDIHLAGGNYFVTSALLAGSTKIYVDGSASVYVEGSIGSVGAEQWELAPGATLDLFVSGNVLSVGKLSLGNAADPTAFRLYIGGSDNVTVGAVGQTEIAGSIYAPRATLAYVGDARITGSIFAKSLLGTGTLSVVYGDGSTQPTSCEPTDEGAPTFL